jgi:hypothetical protein
MNLEAVRAFVTVAEEGQFQLTRVSCHAADVRCERGHSGAAKARPVDALSGQAVRRSVAYALSRSSASL